MTICPFFLKSMSESIPSSPATSEGIFVRIFSGAFRIFNKIGTLFVSQSGLEAGFPWKIKICQNCPNRLNFFASTGHDLVNFNKKYQLPPFLVLKGFKTTEICNKIWILEPQTYIRFFNFWADEFEALKFKSYYIFQLFCSLLVPEKVATDIFY